MRNTRRTRIDVNGDVVLREEDLIELEETDMRVPAACMVSRGAIRGMDEGKPLDDLADELVGRWLLRLVMRCHLFQHLRFPAPIFEHLARGLTEVGRNTG